MGLIEPVLGKLFHEVENFIRLVLRHIARKGTLQKDAALLGHFLRFLFAHGSAQQIGPTQCIFCRNLGNLHYLFLIDDNSVGIFQAILKFRQRIGNFDFSMLALDEFIHHA